MQHLFMFAAVQSVSAPVQNTSTHSEVLFITMHVLLFLVLETPTTICLASQPQRQLYTVMFWFNVGVSRILQFPVGPQWSQTRFIRALMLQNLIPAQMVSTALIECTGLSC